MPTPENWDAGVTHIEVPVMTITVDPQTMNVSYKCTVAPIYFWQMCVGEVVKQLDEQRRISAAKNIQQALRDQAKAQALLDSVNSGR